ncbi:MAG: transporter [Gemmatimonadetes bacterium]|nr:transporter [Gemmatimonadota bacterium]
MQVRADLMRPPLRFDRNEIAGAFGDMGTDVPLLVGVALAARLDGASLLLMFGLMQILTGLVYRMPMPVQPLKAMAAIVIAQQTSAAVLFGGGLAIGVAMLLLSASGILGSLERLIPKSVVRGIQFGLGLQLASIALGRYVQADGTSGYLLAAGAFVVVILLLGNRRFPAALPVVAIATAYAVLFKLDGGVLTGALGFHLPQLHVPRPPDVLAGFLILALPQIPLSLGNSVLATRQLAADLFPERAPGVRTIGFTYAIMNLINPWFGGMPTCHGSGGMAGHYAFGGRTGGSVIIYGAFFVLLGLFFGPGFDRIAGAFPLPVLGVLLLFEALGLIWLIRDTAHSRSDLPIAALVGLCAVGLPYGYVVGMLVGTALVRLGRRANLVTPDAV